MDEDLTDITAQLALHTTLLEQLFANLALHTGNPTESWKTMCQGILQASQSKAEAPDNMSEQDIIHVHAYHHARLFCEQVTQIIENTQLPIANRQP